MNDRHSVNTITSDALDHLYDERDGTHRMYLTAMGDLGTALNRLDHIRQLHQPVSVVAAAEAGTEPDCATCGPNRWPCPTYTALDQPAPTATEIDSSPLRNRIAAALYERERPPRDPHWADAYAMDREVFEAMADAVLPVVQPELDALAPAAAEADPFSYEERERTGRNAGLVFPAATEAAAWTPPPPGDTREQLPNHLLALINAPDYLSTACEAAILLAWQMPKHTHRRVELGEHSDRLHSRCRLQNKFTGVACRCDCHATTKEN